VTPSGAPRRQPKLTARAERAGRRRPLHRVTPEIISAEQILAAEADAAVAAVVTKRPSGADLPRRSPVRARPAR